MIVAMGLTSLVVLALLAVAQLNTTLQQDDRMTSQALLNGRAAMEELTAVLRKSGLAALSGTLQNGVPPSAPTSLTLVTVLNNSTGAPGGDGPDELRLITADTTTLQTLMVDTDNTPVLLVDQAGTVHANDFIVISDLADGTLYRLNADPSAADVGGAPGFALAFSPPPIVPLPQYIKGA